MANENNDFYLQAAQRRALQLETEKAAALADLAAHRSTGDSDGAAETIQTLANIEAEKTNLLSLHRQYVESQQAPRQSEPTDEERAARPWHRMDLTDALEMARGSRFAKDMKPDDPNFVAGVREAWARRGRGE